MLKWNRPKGVMNGVSLAESSDKGICQKTMLPSSLRNTLAIASIPRLCSTDGSASFSLHTYSFSPVQSTHSLSLGLSSFGTMTIPAHQSVGYATRVLTPSSSILWSSPFTFTIRGIGILLGVLREYGTTFGFSFMWYGCCTSQEG